MPLPSPSGWGLCARVLTQPLWAAASPWPTATTPGPSGPLGGVRVAPLGPGARQGWSAAAAVLHPPVSPPSLGRIPRGLASPDLLGSSVQQWGAVATLSHARVRRHTRSVCSVKPAC